MEQSNLIDVLSGKALRRLPRGGSTAVYLGDLATGVEQSNLIDVLSGKALRRLPQRGSAAVYSEDLASVVNVSECGSETHLARSFLVEVRPRYSGGGVRARVWSRTARLARKGIQGEVSLADMLRC